MFMPSSRLARLRRVLVLGGLLTLTGCGDSAYSLLRTAINLKSELTDHLVKVTDEESAKIFFEERLTAYKDKVKPTDDKWMKFVGDIEADYRSKKLMVIVSNTRSLPGSEEWRRDLDKGPNVEDARVDATRDSFTQYMHHANMDEKRVKRETQRLQGLVNFLVEKARKEGNAAAAAADICPNLVKLSEPEALKLLLVYGAQASSGTGN